MPVTEGTEQDKPVVASVDPKALATAFAHGLREVGFGAQQQQTAARQSSFEKVFSTLKSNPDNDEGSLLSIKSMLDAHGEDLKADLESKSNATLAQELGKQRDRHAVNLIRLSLDGYIGDDAVLKDYLPMLQNRVIERFNSEDKFADLRIRYGNGDVDVEALKTLALEEVNKFNKARGVDQKTKSPTGIKGGGNMETVAIASERAESEEGGKTLNPDRLNQQERDLFHAKLGIAQKMGHKRDSKEALEMASKSVLNLRNGKALAKEKLGSR